MMLTLLLLAQLGSIQFYTKISPDTIYVGQQATYDAVVLIPQREISRMSKNPQYFPAEIRGSSVYEFTFDESRMDDITLRGTLYKRVVFRRGVFPLTEGAYTIPSATVVVTYNDPMGGEREETFKSEAVSFFVKPLPARGKPVDFAGAVGQYRDTAFVDTRSVVVGKPIVLTLRILGVGDVLHLPRPLLNLDWASVIESEERVNWDSTGSFVRGYKEFDWLITPTIVGDLIIPAVRFDHFNPSSGQYSVSSTFPIQIKVADRTGGEIDSFRPTSGDVKTSPFPEIIRIARDYWIVSLAILLAFVFVCIFLAIRAAGRKRNRHWDD